MWGIIFAGIGTIAAAALGAAGAGMTDEHANMISASVVGAALALFSVFLATLFPQTHAKELMMGHGSSVTVERAIGLFLVAWWAAVVVVGTFDLTGPFVIVTNGLRFCLG